MNYQIQSKFDLLPSDIFLLIICKLDNKQIFRITRVCKRFQHLVSLIRHIPYEYEFHNSGINPFVVIIPSLLNKLPNLISIDYRYGPIDASRFIPIIYARMKSGGYSKKLSEFLLTKPAVLNIKLDIEYVYSKASYSIEISKDIFVIKFRSRVRSMRWIDVLIRWYKIYQGKIVIDASNGKQIYCDIFKKLRRKKIPIDKIILKFLEYETNIT